MTPSCSAISPQAGAVVALLGEEVESHIEDALAGVGLGVDQGRDGFGGWAGGGGGGVGERADVGLLADHGLELADGVFFLLYLVGPGLVVGGLCHVSWLCGVLVMSLAILFISSCTLPVNCPVTYLTTGK